MSDEFLAFAEIAQEVPTAWSVGFAFGAFLAVTALACWRSQNEAHDPAD